MVDDEIRRITRYLEALVRLKKMPVRRLERQLGFGGGTFNRIFAGRIELKVRHILLVLEALEVPAPRFFRFAFEHDSGALSEEQVLSDVERLILRRPDEEPPTRHDRDEIRSVVLEALREMGFEPPQPPGAQKPGPAKKAPRRTARD